MRSFVALLALVAFCDARPRYSVSVSGPAPSFNFEPFVIGGVEATPHEFPWQLSMQRYQGVWAHSCGASLLAANYALCAGHCVDGASYAVIRVIAGLHDRTTDVGVTANLVSYTIHEQYNVGYPTYTNDVSILNLASPIEADGTTIGYATLPADNSNDYAGQTCTISGWGRTSSSNILPATLQKADIGVISQAECDALMAGVSGTRIWEGHICLYDTANQIGSCNGDSGGPLNCEGGKVVAGITSWGVSSGGDCLQTFPSVYTRTSFYLDWINAHFTP